MAQKAIDLTVFKISSTGRKDYLNVNSLGESLQWKDLSYLFAQKFFHQRWFPNGKASYREPLRFVLLFKQILCNWKKRDAFFLRMIALILFWKNWLPLAYWNTWVLFTQAKWNRSILNIFFKQSNHWLFFKRKIERVIAFTNETVYSPWGVPLLIACNNWCRSSHQRCSIKESVLKNIKNFTGKHLCRSLFFNKVAGLVCNFIKKEALPQAFSCEICKIFKKTFLQNTSRRLFLLVSEKC